MDYHLRGPLALPPAPQRFQVRSVCVRVGLHEGDKLGRRELISLDPAQDVVERGSEKRHDRVDTIGAIERWFLWRVLGRHRYLAPRRSGLVAGSGTPSRML